jgi:uncharacterized protein DUF6817
MCPAHNSRFPENKFRALKELGVGEFAHLNGSLEEHLLGTYELLAAWKNPRFVCVAGLYHAVYGTQPMKALGIPHNDYSPSDRPKIRKIIGARAEALVYLYGACDRDYFYPQIGSRSAAYRDRFTGTASVLAPRPLSNLLEITMANELEICRSSRALLEQHRSWFVRLFDRFEGYVSTRAFARYRETFAA